MDLILVLGVAYLLYATGALHQLGLTGPTPLATTPSTPAQAAQATQALATQQAMLNQAAVGGIPAQSSVQGVRTVPLMLSTAATIGSGAVTGAVSLSTTTVAGVSGAALGAATAGIGAVAAIAVALWSAHEARVAAAKSENSAVNIGVQGFDSDLKTIQSYYNSGQINAQEAIQSVTTALAHYWALVSPHIQSGRNGCVSGEHCPPHPISCSGSIGAACCIGCAPLYMSLYDDGSPDTDTSPPGPGVVYVLQQGGGVAQIKKVWGSSYGTTTREGYTMMWRQVGAA